MEEKQNDFDLWSELKKKLENKSMEHIYFKEGDIWWISIGKNIGSESVGKGKKFMRPILVFKKLSSDSLIALPITTKVKKGNWFCEIDFKNEKRTILLNQIRMIHKNRFQRKIGEIDNKDFEKIKKKLSILLNLSLNHHLPKKGESMGYSQKNKA